MANKTQVNWSDILSKFSSYEGTIAQFCKENNIKTHQLYYHRKKLRQDNPSVFHGIKVGTKDLKQPESKVGKESAHIRVSVKESTYRRAL